MKHSKELYHHGILGQKWGKKNGPPYPLDAKDHSAAEKKAGWRKSLGKSSDVDTKTKKTYTSDKPKQKKGLTSEQKKKLVKIGAAVAVAGLAAYGGYKLYQNGAFDSMASNGKKSASFLSGNLPDEIDYIADTNDLPSKINQVSSDYFPSDHIYAGLPKLSVSETDAETLDRANPYKGENGRNNCVYAAIAGFLRSEGVDITAKQAPNCDAQNGPGVAEEVFRALNRPENRRRVMDGSAITFGKSREDAERMLKKRYGDNAKGFVNVQWKDGGGHAFNFEIVDGKVIFKDYKYGYPDWKVSQYWNFINQNGHFSMIRLDGLVPDNAALKEINDVRT